MNYQNISCLFFLAVCLLTTTAGCQQDMPVPAALEMNECPPELELFAVNNMLNPALMAEAGCLASCLTFLPREEMIITSGGNSITSPASERITSVNGRSLRVETSDRQEVAGLLFRYHGLPDNPGGAGNNTATSQIALRMFLDDPCNLVNVTWRFWPEEKLVVALKTNHKFTTSSECGNNGYTWFNEEVAPVNFPPQGLTTPGDSTYHSLLATIEKYPDPENPADTDRKSVV